jgi:hypothetical protein
MTENAPSETKTETKQNLANFSKSMKVKMMDTRKQGGAAAPTFNVFADGKLINDDALWCSLRNFLASQPYALKFQEPSPAGSDLHRCSICHSIEHPRGLCPFPKVKGWNGPFWDFPYDNRSDGNKRYRQTNLKRGNKSSYR